MAAVIVPGEADPARVHDAALVVCAFGDDERLNLADENLPALLVGAAQLPHLAQGPPEAAQAEGSSSYTTPAGLTRPVAVKRSSSCAGSRVEGGLCG
jgi:hypothetical protein